MEKSLSVLRAETRVGGIVCLGSIYPGFEGKTNGLYASYLPTERIDALEVQNNEN